MAERFNKRLNYIVLKGHENMVFQIIIHVKRKKSAIRKTEEKIRNEYRNILYKTTERQKGV